MTTDETTTEAPAEEEEQQLQYTDDEQAIGAPTEDIREEGGDKAKEEGGNLMDMDVPQATTGGAPKWVVIPADLKFPRGRQAIFLRFRSEWTDTPWIGDPIEGETGKWRQCICWTISIGDKTLGLNRAKQDPNRVADELSKQMIRAIDGHTVKWDGTPGPGNVEQWWAQMGERVRMLVSKVFLQLHMMKREELRDFFENCVAVRSTG